MITLLTMAGSPAPSPALPPLLTLTTYHGRFTRPAATPGASPAEFLLSEAAHPAWCALRHLSLAAAGDELSRQLETFLSDPRHVLIQQARYLVITPTTCSSSRHVT